MPRRPAWPGPARPGAQPSNSNATAHWLAAPQQRTRSLDSAPALATPPPLATPPGPGGRGHVFVHTCMRTSIHTSMHIYTHIHVHKTMCTCTHVRKSTCIGTHVHTQAHPYTCAQPPIRTHTDVPVCVHVCTRSHTNIHAHVYKYKYTHTSIQTCVYIKHTYTANALYLPEAGTELNTSNPPNHCPAVPAPQPGPRAREGMAPERSKPGME